MSFRKKRAEPENRVKSLAAVGLAIRHANENRSRTSRNPTGCRTLQAVHQRVNTFIRDLSRGVPGNRAILETNLSPSPVERRGDNKLHLIACFSVSPSHPSIVADLVLKGANMATQCLPCRVTITSGFEWKWRRVREGSQQEKLRLLS